MKKTTRISALILILALLMNLSGAAFATSEGIPIGDLEMSDFEMFTMAALEEEESQEEESITGDLDDPLGMIGECGDIYCGYVKYMLEELTTAQDRYDYMMDLYADPVGVALELTMAHYYGKAIHRETNLLCTCNFPSYTPEYQVGIVLDPDGNALVDEEGNEVKHADNCPWNFNKLSTAEQFKLISTDDANLKAQFEEVMSAEAAEKLSRVNAKEYMAEADAVTVQIAVPENAFEENENYILTANETALSEEESAALAAEEATNVLAAFDISFPSLADEDEKLQPAESVPLTFTVDVSGVEGESVRVFHIKNDGSVEFVGEPIAIEEDAKSVTIEVEAESFSKWGVDLWYGKEFTVEETGNMIGYLNKEKFSKFAFFSARDWFEVGQVYEKTLDAEDCPDYLILTKKYTSEDGETVIYEVDTFDDNFYFNGLGASKYGSVYSKYFSEIVPAYELYATIPEEVSGGVDLMTSPYGNAINIPAAAIAGEYKIEALERGYSWYYKLTPSNIWPEAADGYYWVDAADVAKISPQPSKTVKYEEWNGENATLAIYYNNAEAASYQWYKSIDGVNWEVIEGATDNNLQLIAGVESMKYAYRCEALDANGNALEVSNKIQLLSNDLVNWLRDKSKKITDEILSLAKKATDRGTKLEEAIGVTSANELVWLYETKALAAIDEQGLVYDYRYYIPVAQVIDGMVYPLGETPATTETTEEATA